jgi:phosphatidylserine/phosphatidylglycerophosphate/cardiolipin synthase-like enzyme
LGLRRLAYANMTLISAERAIARAAAARKMPHILANILRLYQSFTSAPIAQAVVEAHARGVRTEATLDKSQRMEHYSEADFLAHAGIPVLIDDKHAIAHNKIMVIDANVLITGSFNFTKAAEEHDAENLLIIRNRDLAARYTENWNIHTQHSVPYSGR